MEQKIKAYKNTEKTFCISHIYSLREYAYKQIYPRHCCYSLLYLMPKKQTRKERKVEDFLFASI